MNKMKLMCRESHINEEQSEIFTSSSMIESIAFKGDTQGEKAHVYIRNKGSRSSETIQDL